MLTVVMATCNGARTLPKVLSAYCDLHTPSCEWSLLIVDDGSTDGTAEVIEQFADRLPLRYLQQPRSGKNAALNLALGHLIPDTDTSLFVFTDDDATPEPDWLEQLHACAEANPESAIFGGRIVPDWAATPAEWVMRLVPLGVTYAITDVQDGPVHPGLIWGPNMAVRRTVFDAGHRFNSAVGPAAGSYAMGSETEFNRRVASAGYRAWFCNAAEVSHFIRPHQLEATFILGRAYRFGRGTRAQEARTDVPYLWQVPRWMFARYLKELIGTARAWLAQDKDALFLSRWERNYLRGFFHESWHGIQRQCKRVLVTSCSGELGGMEIRMAQEARLLRHAGWQATVATPRFPQFEGFASALRADRIDVAVFDPPQFFEKWQWRRTNKLRAQLFAAPQMRKFRPDLVHVAFCWTSYGASALWLTQYCKIPSVISVHNAFPATTFARWYRPQYAEAFRSVRGIYAVSASAMDHFLAIFQEFIQPDTRLAVIPNSVDVDCFLPSPARRAAARARFGLPADCLVLGTVARLAPQKRPLALIELFASLRPRFPDLHLVLVGSGPLEAEVRERVDALGLSPFVIFAGFVCNVEEVLPAFDLHVLLSQNEGFGIATIEAMACGVPAVGTNVPGTADILRDSDGGVLVPLDDAAQAADIIAALLADPVRRAQMGENARREMVASYTPEILKQRVRAFYEGLAP